MRATEGAWRIAPHFAANNRPIGRVVAALVIFVVALGAFVAFRRAAGAITSPLPLLPLCGTAAALLAWALCTRFVATRHRPTDRLLTNWLPALALLLFAVGCSYPGARAIDWLVWGAAGAGLGLTAVRRIPDVRRPPTRETVAQPEEQVLQCLTRYRGQCGEIAIRGTLVAEFAAGQRTSDLFVAFCPPFERLPEVESNVADDSSASVKVAQLVHNGVQLEVRLPAAAEHAVRVTIEFFAAETTFTATSGPSLAV
jgi:hypothetical protein